MLDFKLFQHQEEFVDLLRRDVAKHKRVIGCAPTGAGKTKMFIAISYFAQAKGKAVLIITESDKIFKQIIKERQATLIMAGVKRVDIRAGKVYVAMAQTLKLRPKMIEEFAALGDALLCVNDEAHVGTANKIIRALTEAWHIGFTASPDSRRGKHLYELYNYVTCTEKMTPEWLVNNLFLASYRHLARRAANLGELETDASGEYTEESQERVFGTRVVYDGLEKDLATMTYKKCIIYCSSIKHAEHTYQDLREHGFNACIVHSQAPPGELYKFMGAEADICVSVGILTKGFDFDLIDLVVLYRKTSSLPLYLQMCGRGSRQVRDDLGNLVVDEHGRLVKQGFTVLDYGENFMEHEYWITDRDWKALAGPQKRRKKKESAPAVKTCPQCEAFIPVSTRVCPYCGYMYPEKPKEAPPDSVLVDMTQRYQKIKGKRISQLTPEELASYAKVTGRKQYAIRVARKLTDTQPTYLREYAIHMGYNKVFHHIKEKEPSQPFNDILIQ